MGANSGVLLRQVAGNVFPGSHRLKVTVGEYKSVAYNDLDTRQNNLLDKYETKYKKESHRVCKNQSLPITAASLRPWVAFSFKAFEMN